MSETKIETVALDAPSHMPDRKQGWFAAGSVVGAILASTCCIAPLLLLMLGVSGAWIGNLTALEPYKPIFAGVALVFIGLGFRQVYFRLRADCEAGSYCARPASALITKSALWLSTVLVVLALTINWWAPLFY
jgi:mercuric ion transport protein